MLIEEARARLARWTFMPHWEFELDAVDLFWAGQDTPAILRIRSYVPNTYNPAEMVSVTASYPLPPLRQFDGRAFDAFLRRSVHHRMCHEADEWLRRDGDMIWNPHAHEIEEIRR
jgi:hypothetical protein